MRRRLAAVLLLALPLSMRAAPAQDLQLELDPYFRGLRTITLTAGAQKLVMLVDTGGGVSAISPQSAAAMGCVPFGRDVGHRMTGEAVTFQRCESATLAAGRWSHTFAPVGVFDIAALLPKELPHLDGVLTLDAFAGRVVTFNWAANNITIVDPAREREAVAATGVPFRAATGETGRFLTAFLPVAGTRGPLWFLLDSGNIRGTLAAESVMAETLLPLGAGKTARLAIGGRPAIELEFTTEKLAIDGALGTDLLMRGAVTLDLRPYGRR